MAQRRAIMLTRLNAPPSAVPKGCVLGMPFSNRYCGCGLGAIKSASRVLFECPWRNNVRHRTSQWTECSVDTDPELLADARGENVPIVAKFLVQAVRIRACYKKSAVS